MPKTNFTTDRRLDDGCFQAVLQWDVRKNQCTCAYTTVQPRPLRPRRRLLTRNIFLLQVGEAGIATVTAICAARGFLYAALDEAEPKVVQWRIGEREPRAVLAGHTVS